VVILLPQGPLSLPCENTTVVILMSLLHLSLKVR
jgi:hypothetical protein